MISQTNQKKWWSLVGIFMMSLLISLPIYSAQALAVSVQITKNSGQAGIPNYLNSVGDVWTVEAKVSNLGTGSSGTSSGSSTSGTETGTEVTPEQMQINIEGSTEYFDSCSSTTGGYLCQFVNDISSGASEGTYEIKVKHLPSGAGDGASISADGSAPTISFTQFQQRGADILLDFTATDEPSFGVGLAKVEVVDADSGSILETYTPEAGRRSFNYKSDGTSGGKLSSSASGFLSGEGMRKLKITAEDRLGHVGTSVTRLLSVDFIAPDALNVSFIELGDFVGAVRLRTPMVAYVRESSLLSEVTAHSEQVTFASPRASCTSLPARMDVPESEHLWKCIWDVVEVTPASNVAVTLRAVDAFGNVGEESVSKDFTVDDTPPAVEFFGSNKEYQGNYYVKDGVNTIFLRVAESGIGMDASGIRANLGALGGGIDVVPVDDIWHCAQIGSIFACNWTITGTSVGGLQSVRISLNKLQDKVGNAGDLSASVRDLLVDTGKPAVESIEMFGVGADGREKEYFQSGDTLKFKVKIAEPRSGIFFKVNMNEVVNDAQTQFPATERSLAGWQVFTDDACVSASEGSARVLDCVFQTSGQLQSGYEDSAFIQLEVEDSAGNKANQWPEEKSGSAQRSGSGAEEEVRYAFKKLAVKDEPNPDYWEVARGFPKLAIPFVDLDVTELTPFHLPVDVKLSSRNHLAKVVGVDVLSCVPVEPIVEEGVETPLKGPELSRSLLYGGVSATGDSSPTLKVLLEFAPFNGREHFKIVPPETAADEETFEEATADYTCQLQIFSKVGNEAIQAAEIQEVPVTAVFAFSELGSQDEALEQLIKQEREAATSTYWEVIATLNTVVKWLGYATKIVSIGYTAIELYNTFKPALIEMNTIPGGGAADIAQCVGMSTAEKAGEETVSAFRKIVNLFSCTTPTGIEFFDTWQGGIIDLYNTYMSLGSAEFINNFITITSEDIVLAEVCPNGNCKFKPAVSLRDNVYLSFAGVCIPGMVQNIYKLRDIQCRQIYCYENEVKNGLATINSCNQLESQLICKYFVGELWYLIPFSQFYDAVINLLREGFKNPIALTHTVNIAFCASVCPFTTIGAEICSFTNYLWDAVGFFESIVGTVLTLKSDIESGGLTYCDSVLGDEEEEETPEEAPAEESATSETAETG